MIRVLFSRFFAAFRRRFLDDDFDAEVQAHLDMLIEKNVRRGMTAAEAQQAGCRSLGQHHAA